MEDTVEIPSKIIGKTVRYGLEDGKTYTGEVMDKVKCGLATGTNEYVVVDKYMILRKDSKTLDDVYPYFVDSILD